MKWFKKRFNWKTKFPDQKHIIEEAFEVKGRKFYQFTDIFQLPYERGLYALAIYEECRMRCSREYLERHIDAMRKILHSEKIDIFRVNQLNEQMSDRLNLTLDVDLLYKLASVSFFDETENPALYDQVYCQKKIDFWKENKGTADFFLQQPLTTLIPFLQNVDFNLNEYSILNQQLNRIHSERLQ
jgi:hypothetical protein